MTERNDRMASDPEAANASPTSATSPATQASPTPSLDALGKQAALDAALEWARVKLLLETLDTRGRDALDFHEISVSAIRDVVRHAFETGYRGGLHTGYRQGRSDACDEASGREAPSQPRNPDLTT